MAGPPYGSVRSPEDLGPRRGCAELVRCDSPAGKLVRAGGPTFVIRSGGIDSL